MNHQFNILSLLLFSGCAAITWSSPVNAIDTHGLLEKSKLDLTLKNVWMLNTTNQFEEEGVGPQNAWAQGILVDYRSGWFDDWAGMDASWYGVTKLYANDAFYGRDLLRDNNGHAEGFNKIGQLYAKFKWGNEEQYARLYAGWRQLYKFGVLNVTRSRAAPSSWEGISLETGWDSISARGAIVNRFSERDEPEKRRFMTLKSKKTIDYIATADVTWTPSKGNSITYVIGESKNYLLRHGLEGSGKYPLGDGTNIIYRGVYYYNKGLSEWEGTHGFKDDAQHIFGLVGYQIKKFEGGIGWSKTQANLEKGVGHFYWNFGKNTRGAFNSRADGEGNDYINDGEQMIYVYSQYQFTPEFIAGVYGNYGFDVEYQGVPLHEWEYGAYFSWSPEALSGLNIFAGVGPSYGWKPYKGHPWITEDKSSFHRSKGIGATVRVEYRFGLL